MSDPIVSFVIPVYKKPAEIFERCIASLKDMSLKDIEIIAVFDGADEELESVVRRFPGVVSVVIEHGGAPKARNAGLDIAKGKYVSFWDSDCFAAPEMAARWIQEFDATGADFVYSGYRFEDEAGGYPSEPFDSYSLQCGNFIASMFPILRSKAPRWDESLLAAQDWDFWLTATENGCKGAYIQGFGFSTPLPDKDSISGRGWGLEKRKETIARIKEKHGIPQRKIAVASFKYYLKGLHIAKLIGADMLKQQGMDISDYDMVFNLSYGPYVRFHGAKDGCTKVQFWMPYDIDCLYEIAFKTARETIKLANTEITKNFCNDIFSRKRLKDLGIEAEVLPLPTEIDDLEQSLPEDFRALIDCDEAHKPILKDLPKAVPHIKVDFLESVADIKQYSLLLSFYEHPTVDEGIRRFLLNGRHVISNVEAPYCGNIDLKVSHQNFKNEIINQIMDARVKPFNKKAQDYYSTLVDPERFKKALSDLQPKPELVLEVAS
jgi:glycosyltransferase involved in cell wall biosynthesis